MTKKELENELAFFKDRLMVKTDECMNYLLIFEDLAFHLYHAALYNIETLNPNYSLKQNDDLYDKLIELIKSFIFIKS